MGYFAGEGVLWGYNPWGIGYFLGCLFHGDFSQGGGDIFWWIIFQRVFSRGVISVNGIFRVEYFP